MRDNLGECGFDRLRFGGEAPAVEGTEVSDVLPLLIHIGQKSKRMVGTLSAERIRRIVSVCAGTEVAVTIATDGEDLMSVSFRRPRLRLHGSKPCGLRDLIFAATLIRTYRRAGEPDRFNLQQLIKETWTLLAEELPASLTYSTAASKNDELTRVPVKRAEQESGGWHLKVA